MNRPDELPVRRRGPVLLAAAGLTAIFTVALFGALGALRGPEPVPAQARAPALPETTAPALQQALPVLPATPPPVRLSVVTVRLLKDQTLAQALFGLSLGAAEVKKVVGALTNVFPFRHARPGDQLRLERIEGEQAVRRFTYRQSAADEWIVQTSPDGALQGTKRQVELHTELARVAVTIQSSLYESIEKSGEDPSLAVDAADVLAWDVDFYQDVRAGDSMKILVQKVFADGKFLRYGEVLAAEYAGSAVGRKRLFRYTDPTGQISYFDDAGNSARRGFLKSPLKYAHVVSKFGNRMHPILGYMKAHQGIDYAAPTGTPVWAVGDASVEQAGWNGGCGKSVTLRHRNGLETVYCHLSLVSVHAGARVTQKQVIGAVGATGMATGPHLHFGVKQAGHYVNPLSLKVPRDAPVAPQLRADFLEKTAPLKQQLDAAGPAVL
jgi:murein DD-endopeptidase MepM/ murein hydrolase activator NlpD